MREIVDRFYDLMSELPEAKRRELRESARERLGERFDLREFHDVIRRDVILCDGPMPLTMLEERVMPWEVAREGQ